MDDGIAGRYGWRDSGTLQVNKISFVQHILYIMMPRLKPRDVDPEILTMLCTPTVPCIKPMTVAVREVHDAVAPNRNLRDPHHHPTDRAQTRNHLLALQDCTAGRERDGDQAPTATPPGAEALSRRDAPQD